MREDSLSFRQYAAAIGVSLFSPVSRLLPEAVLKRAGFSGWLSPLPALPLLLGLVWCMQRLLSPEGETLGLGQALERRLGTFGGKGASALLSLWTVAYGGLILRSGAERILSTLYPMGSLPFFMGAMLVLGLVFACNPLRWAGRCAMVTALFFAGILGLVFLMALPGVHLAALWPPDLSRSGDIALGALPVADVLSRWVCFAFLRGRVSEAEGARRRAFRGMLALTALTVLFQLTTVGSLGPELALRQQFPFYVMIKNLRLFGGAERFDALALVLWVLTDFVCVGMLLASASEGLRGVFGSERRERWVLPCAGGMLLGGLFLFRDAFGLLSVSQYVFPAINLGLSFGFVPLLAVLRTGKKNLKKEKNRC